MNEQDDLTRVDRQPSSGDRDLPRPADGPFTGPPDATEGSWKDGPRLGFAAVPERENVLSSPMAAGLLLTLKRECEAEHERAEQLEQRVIALTNENEKLKTALTTIIAKWRASGAHIDTFHATMGTGYKQCANEPKP